MSVPGNFPSYFFNNRTPMYSVSSQQMKNNQCHHVVMEGLITLLILVTVIVLIKVAAVLTS